MSWFLLIFGVLRPLKYRLTCMVPIVKLVSEKRTFGGYKEHFATREGDTLFLHIRLMSILITRSKNAPHNLQKNPLSINYYTIGVVQVDLYVLKS